MPLELNKPKPEGTPWIVILGIVIVVVLGLFIAYNSLGGGKLSLPSFSSQAKQEVILLQAANCVDCVSLASAQGVFTVPMRNVTSSEELNQLVARYSITKLPALIVSNQSLFTEAAAGQAVQEFSLRNGALIYETTAPPYYDVAEKKVKGLVNLTVISPVNCTECFSSTLVTDRFANIGVKFKNIEEVTEDDVRGAALITQYSLNELPGFIFSPDLLVYPGFASGWSQIGSTETDGNLVLKKALFAPYKNLSINATEGLVSVTYLNANVCRTCYNATLHHNVLIEQFRMTIVNETIVDASSPAGNALLRQYNVTKLPTILISKQATAYFDLVEAWKQVGSIERDGVFVFRAVDQLQGVNYTTANNGIVSSNAIASASAAPEGVTLPG